MQRTCRLIFSEQACVKTWADKALAIMKTKGRILGYIDGTEQLGQSEYGEPKLICNRLRAGN